MGRRKIKIRPIKTDRNRQVTLNKRKFGLMKKAYELSVLCDCEIALIIIDSEQRKYLFGSHEIGGTLRFFTESTHDPIESHTNTTIQKLIERREKREGGYDDEDDEDDAEDEALILQQQRQPPSTRGQARRKGRKATPQQIATTATNSGHHHHNNTNRLSNNNNAVSTAITSSTRKGADQKVSHMQAHDSTLLSSIFKGTSPMSTQSSSQSQLQQPGQGKQVTPDSDSTTFSSSSSSNVAKHAPSTNHGLHVFIPSRSSSSQQGAKDDGEQPRLPSNISTSFPLKSIPVPASFLGTGVSPLRLDTAEMLGRTSDFASMWRTPNFSPGLLCSPVAGDLHLTQSQQQQFAESFELQTPRPLTVNTDLQSASPFGRKQAFNSLKQGMSHPHAHELAAASTLVSLAKDKDSKRGSLSSVSGTRLASLGNGRSHNTRFSTNGDFAGIMFSNNTSNNTTSVSMGSDKINKNSTSINTTALNDVVGGIGDDDGDVFLQDPPTSITSPTATATTTSEFSPAAGKRRSARNAAKDKGAKRPKQEL